MSTGSHEIPRDRADRNSVVQQCVGGSHPQQNAPSKTVKGDADVMLGVKPGHDHPLTAIVPGLAPTRSTGVRSALVRFRRLLQLLEGDHPPREVRLMLDQSPRHRQGAEKQQAGRNEIPKISAKHSREPRDQEVFQALQPGGRCAVKGVVTPGHEIVEIVGQRPAPAA